MGSVVLTVGIALGPTLTSLFVSVLLLAAGGAVVVTVAALVFGPAVDRRWPTARPLSSSELAWARVGRFIEETFRGVDLVLAHELADQMEEVDVAAGAVLIRQGDPATHWFLLTEGEVEVSQRIVLAGGQAVDQHIRRMPAGSFFGEVAIMRRTPATATVRTVGECVVQRLGAEAFVAGAARRAADEHVLLRAVDHYLAEDRARVARLQAAVDTRNRS